MEESPIANVPLNKILNKLHDCHKFNSTIKIYRDMKYLR